MSEETVLIIEDEALVRDSLRDVLLDEGYNVKCSDSYQKAQSILSHERVDVVLLDIWLGHEDGLELLPRILHSPTKPYVIMISGHGSIEAAVRCTKTGAYDFLEKPISIDRLLITICHALAERRLRNENESLRLSRVKAPLMGRSKQVLELHQSVASVAKSNSSVLICGENGSGKEVIAQLIHASSNRSSQPFIAVNCAAIPDSLIESELFGYEKGAFTGANQARLGKVEAASGGTLFLDEVADLSLSAQAKLLRVIQEKCISRLGSHKEVAVNVRWVSATNKDLEKLVREGLFREDLYYRLNVIRIDVAPLRQRIEDIELLAKHFLKECCLDGDFPLKRLTTGALEKLQHYTWPGNVRELKNVIERAVVMCPTEEIDEGSIAFPNEIRGKGEPVSGLFSISSFKEARNEFERQFLQKHLERTGDNISKLASEIGLERTYLYRKLKQHHLDETH